MPTPRKVEMVAQTKDRMERAEVAISTGYAGLSVSQMTALRRAVMEHDAETAVVKNTLAIRAANEAGKPEMVELLSGPTAITFGYGDPVAPVKALLKHIKENDAANIEVIAGWLEGKILSADEVKGLAQLPSKEQLLVNVIAKFQSPLYNFSGLIQSTIRNLNGLVVARADQLEAEDAA